MDRWASLVERIRPFSLAALLVVIGCLGLATIVRMAVVKLGVSVLFPTYFPAVLLAALLAGTPAALAVIAGAILIAWWTFIPPYYEFNPLAPAETANFVLFALSSGCLVAMAHLYRGALEKLRQHDRERDLLLKEMEHRGRNTYAVVEAIVRNTLANDPTSANAIAGRVRAVSSANDLINRSDSKTVQLKALLTLEFEPDAEAQLRVGGPNIALSADAARKLGLVFHELVTNAMKHGALSRPGGCVAVNWRANDAVVHLTWKEEHGPPVLPPQRRGFGTVIVTESLKSLAGDIVFVFDTDGLCCDMHFDCR